ncbi:MAG: membrane protein insertase YidC [Desulfovibrio sp.]|nr:membrane protein insertase YidC [Desulfovibrio sp.]
MNDTSSKNLILAIVLCLVVVFGWSSLAQYMGWLPTPDPEVVAKQEELLKQQAQEEERLKAEAEKAAVIPTFTPSKGQDLLVTTPLYEAVLYSGGGSLRSFALKNYRTSLEPNADLVNIVSDRAAAVAPLGLVINSQPSWSTGSWAVLPGDEKGLVLADREQGSLTLLGTIDGLTVRRVLTFTAENYLINEELTVENPTDATKSLRLAYTVAADSRNAGGDRYDTMRIAWDSNGSLDEESSVDTLTQKGRMEAGTMLWAGAMSNYFLAAVLPGDPKDCVVKGRVQNTVFRAALELPDMVLPPKGTKTLNARYWLGPKDRKMLMPVSEELAKSVDLGFFSLIAKGLLWILQNFYDLVHNWGIAIIMLTFVIKAIFWPLTAKSYASMEKMKKLQPRLEMIKKKYGDDREQMNKEVMGLYKTFGVNPASGCVPILVQLPVFFGLYQALLTFIELRHAPFISTLPGTDILWLADLSSKDPLYITPLLMGLTMFIQQRMSPPPADPTQRKIMMFLPIVFTFLFLGFPSGLVIYWLVNNILSIFQQWRMIHAKKA